jgi:hypothetical protein
MSLNSSEKFGAYTKEIIKHPISILAESKTINTPPTIEITTNQERQAQITKQAESIKNPPVAPSVIPAHVDKISKVVSPPVNHWIIPILIWTTLISLGSSALNWVKEKAADLYNRLTGNTKTKLEKAD